MKNITITATTIGILLSSASAGDYFPAPSSASSIPSAIAAPGVAAVDAATGFLDGMDDWFVTPTVDARLRYEYRDQDGLEESNSGTFRIRPGLKTKSFGGFSAFAEGEFAFALLDDYRSTPTGAQVRDAEPFEAGHTVIADPETTELNQGYIQYAGNGFTAKVGRQRINLDEQQFVGGVAWRNNEQTFDAASLAYKGDGYEVFYAYMDRVNRIFGSGPGSSHPLNSLKGEAHLLNGKFTVGGQKVGAYAYLLDFDDQGAFASSNTFGAFTTLDLGAGSLYLEGAFQQEAGDIKARGNYSDYYAHVKYAQKVGGIAGSAGVITFGEDFVTPLQTAHKFNGFADAFLGNQVGLGNRGGNWGGLMDFYVSGVKKVGGVKVVGALHYYADADFSEPYGWEADLVLVKPINDNLTALGKFAYYGGDDDAANNFSADIAQATIQLDYKF